MRTSPFETPVGPLLSTVFTSILEVFLLCLAGYILAGRGILDKKTQKQINRLNVSLFTPALLFSKVAFFLSPAKLRELWIIPIFFILVTVVSMAISFFLGWMFRLKRSQRSFAMAASMFMNSNSLPIALMQSLVVTVPGLKWGLDDNTDAMVGRALTYLVLYSTLGMVLRWSYGVRLLAQADDGPTNEPTSEPDETSPLLSGSEPLYRPYGTDRRVLRHEPSGSTTTQVNSDEYPESPVKDDGESSSSDVPNIVVQDPNLLRVRPTPRRTRTNIFHSFPNTPNQSHSRLPSFISTQSTSPEPQSDSDTDDEELPTTRRRSDHEAVTVSRSSPLRVFLRRSKRHLGHGWRNLNEFMTVPLWAALASIVVACVRPLQHALDEHMQPVKGSLAAAGQCSIPLTLVVLGAYFYPPPKEEPPLEQRRSSLSTVRSMSSFAKDLFKFKGRAAGQPHSNGDAVTSNADNEKRPGETKTVVIAVLSRMIITPILLLPLMAASARFDIHAVFDDPVFVVSNVLLISSPPALTLAQITQAAASGDAFERLISRTIFWSYCIITPPATIIYVVLGLLLAKL